ncbi:hypothetical protein Tco_0144963, partial [Tanacetum coccineum]
KDEIRINNDITWFSSCDNRREWKKQHIKNVEKDLGEVDHELPKTSVPRTDVGFFPVTKLETISYCSTSSIPIDIGTDKKRCHNRLIKVRMDLEYSKQVQEELLIAKKSDKMPIDGAQELNYVRAEPDDDPEDMGGIGNQTMTNDTNNIVLSQLEEARTIRKGQLIHKLDRLRNDIKSMETSLEKISPLRKKAYKWAYKHGAQQNEVKSSYTEYQSLMTYVKELARRGDTDKLIQVCHVLLFEGCSKF